MGNIDISFYLMEYIDSISKNKIPKRILYKNSKRRFYIQISRNITFLFKEKTLWINTIQKLKFYIKISRMT